MLLAPCGPRFGSPASAAVRSGGAAAVARRRAAAAAARREVAVARMPRLAHREVMLALAGEAEARLGDRLLPSEVPGDVALFANGAGDAVGCVDVRRGAPGSTIDFMLEAWFHRELVGAGAIDITSLIIFLNGGTDAPHFVMELIQGRPTSLVFLLDFFPRRDLPLHPPYIEKYYHSTGVDAHRRGVEQLPEVRPYVSPSLLVRSLWSPTAIVVDVDCREGGEAKLEEIIHRKLAGSAMGVLNVWLEHCAGGEAAEMEVEERESMVVRDKMISAAEMEVNLFANMPRMFDADVSSRVVAEIAKAFMGS